MKTTYVLLSTILAALLSMPLQAGTPSIHRAKTASLERSHPVSPSYLLWRVRVADANPATFVWEVRLTPTKDAVSPPAINDVFQSLKAQQLRDWVSHLPAGSDIVGFFWLGPIRTSSDMQPHGPLWAEVDDFKQYCKSKGVYLNIVLGGG